MASSDAFIERNLYKKICSKLPVVCVDLLIWNDKKLLLVKRRNHPLKGKWWVVGGRILLGEDPRQAAIRKAREEVGVDIGEDFRFVGYYSDIFRENAFQKTKCQTVSLVFVCGMKNKEIKLDCQSSAYKWADAIPKRFAFRY